MNVIGIPMRLIFTLLNVMFSLSFLASCSVPMAPPEVLQIETYKVYNPQPMLVGPYHRWLAEIADCMGEEPPPYGVNFFVADSLRALNSHGYRVSFLGLWHRINDAPDEIWIARKVFAGESAESFEHVVKHELIHHMLERKGHPKPPFGKCEETS